VASQDNSWLEQVPPSLRRAHFAARWAWKWFDFAFGAVQRIFELIDNCENDEDAEFLKEFSACCECAVGLILVARLRLARADRCVKRVAAEFAGVGREMPQWQFANGDDRLRIATGRSVHEFAFSLAWTWLDVCLRAIATEKMATEWNVAWPAEDAFSDEQCRRDYLARLIEIRDGETPVLDEGDIRSHIIATAELAKEGEADELPSNAWMMQRLKGELRRACDRRSHPVSRPRFACDRRHKRRERPTYLRDHVWLGWAESEDLGPARIRDRWNNMAEEERMEICPRAPGRIGKGEPGRDVVKKGLANARQEKSAKQERRD
jgi:hypothetical protein